MFNGKGAFTDPRGAVRKQADILRASYLTPDGNDITQTLAADDTPEVIIFNLESIESEALEVDLPTGVFTAAKNDVTIGTISFQVIRQVAAGIFDDVRWGFFIQTSVDGGQNWDDVEGSTVRETIPGLATGDTHHIELTVGIVIPKGFKFRFLHFTEDATKQMSIISEAAGGGAPSSAGVVASFYTS